MPILRIGARQAFRTTLHPEADCQTGRQADPEGQRNAGLEEIGEAVITRSIDQGVRLITDRGGEAGRSREHHRDHQRPGIHSQIIAQRDGNRRYDDRDGIIGNNLGHDHRQNIDCKDQTPGRHFSQERRQFADNKVDAPGLLQTQADREHAENQHQHIAVD